MAPMMISAALYAFVQGLRVITEIGSTAAMRSAR